MRTNELARLVAVAGLASLTVSLAGCAPQRRETFENINLRGPLKELKGAVVFSENTKNSSHYLRTWKAAQGGMDSGMIFREIPGVFARQFASAVKLERMEEADAKDVDVIAVVDTYITVPAIISMRNVKVEMKVFLLSPEMREIDVLRIETKKFISPLGNTPIGPWVWGNAIKGAEQAALEQLEAAISSSPKLKEYALSKTAPAGGDTAARTEGYRRRIEDLERTLADEIKKQGERTTAQTLEDRQRISGLEERLAQEINLRKEDAARQVKDENQRIKELEGRLAAENRQQAAAQTVEDSRRIRELETRLAEEIAQRKEQSTLKAEQERRQTLEFERRLAEEIKKRKELEEREQMRVAGQPAAKTPEYDVDRPSYSVKENPDNFAVVIGIERYAGVADAEFAERDAAAVREHLLALGYPERNIIYLTGAQAGRASIAKYIESWLPRNVNENTSLFLYYSGHGAPDPKTGQAYLVPWDGDVAFLEDTGYPIKRLYEKLNALKLKRAIVVLDACFSGSGGRSVISRGTRPLVSKVDEGTGVLGKLIVLSASAADEITGTHAEKKHGLFTYYFLMGLSGAALDSNGYVTVRTVYDYLAPKVGDAARRQNRDQTPQLSPAGLSESSAVTFR